MKKIFAFIVGIVFMLILSSSLINAQVLHLPDKAKENSNMTKSKVIEIVDEEFVVAPPGVERRVIIHRAKPGTSCGNGICEAGENAKKCSADCGGGSTASTCYEDYGKGVVWKNFPINYKLNTTNINGLSENFLLTEFDASVSQWDLHTLDDLQGTTTVDTNATWDSQSPDGNNEIVFGNYSDPGTIAVTVTWGYFSGAPHRREIIEFDILFNENFDWGDATIDATKMDFQSITTHEAGHGFGLGDLYTADCSEETMYGYGSEGETKARTLNTGDIIGIQKLYGSQ